MTHEYDLPCDICRDLLPLVRDGVASEASRRAVEDHVAHCEACRQLWGEEAPPPPLHREQVLGRIRRRLYAWQGAMTAAGLILGMALANTGRAGYNILLLPVLGAAVQWLSPRRARWLPLLVWGLITAVTLCPNAHYLLGCLAEGDWYNFFAILGLSILYGLLFGALCALGTLAAALFRYALRKEKPCDALEEDIRQDP